MRLRLLVIRPAANVLPLILAMGAVGCVSAGPQGEIQHITRPEIGQIEKREVGEPLFETIVARTANGLKVAPGSVVRMGPGLTVELSGDLVDMGNGSFCGPAIQTAGLFGPPMHNPLPSGICVTLGTLESRHVPYQLGPVTRADPGNFQQQLIYEGKNGKEIHLSYREFRNDLARPAFTQELTFDLSDGPVIGAKGARIEVLKADNVEIQYRVLKPFSP